MSLGEPGQGTRTRTLLLVDDEQNILSALTRLLRRDGYIILRAGSAKEGLELLGKHKVGVIVSDQRMPDVTGVEFLSEVKNNYPDTVRIMLSGFTELNAVTDAINEGAIFKFLTKPWDDGLLRKNVQAAFEYYELRHENARLTSELQYANEQLAKINCDLEHRVEIKTRESNLNLRVLQVSQEVLEGLPVGVVGIGSDGLVAVANRKANEMLMGVPEGMVGASAAELMPDPLKEILRKGLAGEAVSNAGIMLSGNRMIDVWASPMGLRSEGRGVALVIMERE